MGNKKQLLFNISFVIIVLIFTMYNLFKETDLRSSFNQALQLNFFYLFLGLILILVFVLTESIILRLLLKRIEKPYNFFDCVLYSFIGFLYSSITPSASGGQPAQMYYMKKRGITVGESTPLLMIVTIAYKGVLVMIGAFIMLFNISDIKSYISGLGIYVYFGLISNVVLLFFMILLLVKPELLYVFCKKLYKGLVGKLLGKYRFKMRDKAVAYLDKYVDTAIYYRGHFNNMALPVMLITFIQRIAYFAITIVVYLSFGGGSIPLFVILILSASINIAIDMLPLPGGMGAAELLFLSIFTQIFGKNQVITALLINRFLTFYILIVFGVIATVVANIRFNRKKMVC